MRLLAFWLAVSMRVTFRMACANPANKQISNVPAIRTTVSVNDVQS